MPIRYQVTGMQPGYGNQISHSHHRSWLPNVQRKRHRPPSEGRWLRVSTKGMKTIEKRGTDAVAAEMRARGERF